MFKIQSKSPTRVDLAGGTLDCWPLYLFLDEPVTFNVAIDIFTYAELTERADQKVELESKDLKTKKVYENLQACLRDGEPAFDLVRAHLRYWKPQKGFTLSTRSESPVGGGLGGSSSLCISLLKAFSKWLDMPLETYEMVRIASHLEAQLLLKPTGTQDYFPPIFGGLNTIRYGVQGPQVEVQKLPIGLFKDRFLLVYTGRSHHSGINNWQVIKNWLDGDPNTRDAMAKLAVVSKEMRHLFDEKNFEKLPALFKREYEARTQLSDGFSSPEIRRLNDLADSIGAQLKICGAGGGGCVLIWCAERQAARASELCQQNGFTVLATQPWEESCE